MKGILRMTVPLLLASLIVLAGCTTTSNIPLLLRYTDGTQQELAKITWNPMTGDVITSTDAIATFTDSATNALRELWPSVKPNYWVPLLHPAVSNTAVHWNGSDKLTLFSTDDLQVQENVNVVKVSDPKLCEQYMNATNCIATSTALYAYDRSYDVSTIYKITASETKPTRIIGSMLGIGKSNDKLYVLASKGEGDNQELLLYTIGSDGSIDSKTVENSENKSYDGTWSTFANGHFYMWDAKVSTITGTPQYIPLPSLTDGFQVISSATTLEPFGFTIPEPAFYSYKGYVLAVGQTFSFDEFTVAAFKNDRLVGFMLITPLDGSETTLTTYDATGKQLKSYTIKVPVQVIVPQP